MLRTLLLSACLIGSVYVNILGARLLSPQDALEQFFYRRAVPVLLWAEKRFSGVLKKHDPRMRR